MKLNFWIFLLLISHSIAAQNDKEELLKRDVDLLVEEMEFMYGYDQTMREYTIFKTFDKSETDRLENLPDSLKMQEISQRKFKSDSLSLHIWKNYINPKDAAHVERMIEITRTYGFPDTDRIRKYYDEDFEDPDFDPILMFIHAPKKFREELKELMLLEYEAGRINQCQYGYLLWHILGRQSFQPMLDNGYEMIQENGNTTLKSTCN
ncbi:hypothetical protein [Salinimicrobium sp. GXAS 041]|uniref:hypothetical protein n=1 Tax=Salinimicrobium sp. GXAS 041 TaxID=3400806 RepID=UPI003C73C52A